MGTGTLTYSAHPDVRMREGLINSRIKKKKKTKNPYAIKDKQRHVYLGPYYTEFQ